VVVLRIGPGRHRVVGRRSMIATCALIALLAPVAVIAPARADTQGDIAATTAQAKRIEAAIEASNERIDVLDEQFNQTNVRIGQANAGISDAEGQIGAARRDMEKLRVVLQGRAAELYTQAGARSPIPEFDATNVRDLGTIQTYSDVAASHDTSALDALDAARVVLHQHEVDLKHARDAAQSEAKALASQRSAIVDAQSQQQQLLAKVKGHLAQLVQQQAAENERAAEAAARAAMIRQANAAAAARANTANDTTTAGTNNGNAPTTSGGPSFNPAPAPSAPNGAQAPAPNPEAQVAVNTARAQLGKPYVYAGSGPNVFDCSGLTMFAWAAAGVGLPHSAEMQYDSLPHVDINSLVPGDLVFYGSPIHHVGMFVGGGTMIEAPHTGAVVRYSSIYRPDFAGAARP
jgi:cell wall-associated NlpC family hydrolase